MPQNFPATGNAYLFNTPKSDRVGDLLLQQQRQRDFEAQRQNQLLDTQFSRNVSGMKDADIPELTQKWGDYKQAKLDLYKNGSKMNNNDRIQAELDAQRKLGAAYGVINSSKEDLATIKSHAVAVAKDTKGLYADDARDKLRQWTETPTSQRDKSKDGEIFYPYSIPNLDEELKTARGKQEDFTLDLGQSGTDPMKNDKEIYKVGNNARQFYDSFLGSMVSTNKGKNFTGLTNHIHSESELEDLQNKYYQKVNDPKYILVHGQPQDFPESSNTDLGKAVKIKTMEEVVNSPFVGIKKSETNLDRYNALKNNQRKDAATLSYERAMNKTSFIQDKKDKRVALLTGAGIKDIYGDIDKIPTIEQPVSLVDGTKLRLKEIPSDISNEDKNDLFGKQNKYGEHPNPPIELNGKKYVEVGDNGALKDANGTAIDPDAVSARTYGRMHAVKEAQAKGKIHIGTPSTQPKTKAPSGIKWK